MPPQSRKGFKVAIICALPVEFDAVEALLDEHYVACGKQPGDLNFYRTGRIDKYDIVLAYSPEMGKKSAASVASSLLISFPGINLTILTGICGGVPFPLSDTELILGDVIISSKVAEYDFGKLYPDGFQQRGDFTETLGRADRDIRSFLSALKTQRLQCDFQERHLNHLTHLKTLNNKWQYPGAAHDQLFQATYRHKHHTSMTTCICTDCKSSEDPICGEALESDCNKLGCAEQLIKRTRLTTACNPSPRMLFGPLGSGDTVMKSGEHRDRLAKKMGIIGFEMEGVGICDSLRCIIIKGVSDYADSHKNKAWQEYAAASAASCTKAFLEVMGKTMQKDEEQHCFDSETLRPQGDHPNPRLQNDTSVAINRSENGQPEYQWRFSSRSSSINNIDNHIKSLEEELGRLKENISNPILREVVVSGVAEAVNNHEAFRSLQTTRSFHTSYYRTRFGIIVYRTRVIKQLRTTFNESVVQYKTTTSFIFQPASWLIRLGLKYGIEATSVNSRTGWQYSISPVRAVRDDALIFQFCKTGNVDAVSELFKRGDASVLDVDSKGWRPLHFATSNGHFELAKFLILQGADRTAHVYTSCWARRFTPASFILTDPTTFKTAIDMMLLFDDCIDFDGPMSDGWNLVSSYESDNAEARSEHQIFRDILSSLFRRFNAGLTDYIDAESIHYCMCGAICRADIENIRLILDFDPAVNYFDYDLPEPAIYLVVSMPYVSADILKLLLDRGADIHMVCQDETATSMSLWFSKLFFQWFERLGVIYQELDEFMERETSSGSVLAQANWRCETLRDLLTLKPTGNFKEFYHWYDGPIAACNRCYIIDGIYPTDRVIEPWWEELKYRVKNEQCICSLLGESENWMIDAEDRTICSLCRRCREMSLGKPSKDSGSHAGELDSGYDFDSDEYQGKFNDHQCNRQGFRLPPLERFFHLQGGRWNGQYLPDEYYCSKCLSKVEGWEIDSDSETSDSDDSED
ncbi:hypothetical protein BGW36DRAFT_425259 [Talaromyces proteolyticus]|uniref:Nucleoside phosphorylase domain-containing protein n=1 Tax=Talaromyces proteolyticus TaxID=1131652 RepID=A0AAD4KYK4_9EURO|nr:uncharacterized protein BGW36DRAFT_425259 [Talaromyces proteolyticus]KAH8700436.1 hypothetical protein BGW36DRAFT_425259 [Talaromyces proteolyticus]